MLIDKHTLIKYNCSRLEAVLVKALVTTRRGFNLKKTLIVTNNPVVYEAYRANSDAETFVAEIRWFDGDAEEILVKARDLVYEGYPLISHPLPASIRMIYSPYRSVVLGADAGALDAWHTGIIEESLAKYRQNTGHRTPDKKNAESYKWMDAQLLSVAIREFKLF